MAPGHQTKNGFLDTYILVFGKLALEDEPPDIGVGNYFGVRHVLALLYADQDLSNHLELFPIDEALVLCYERRVSLFDRYEIATMQREEGYPFGRRIFPGKPVREMTLLRPHQDLQAHKVLLGLRRHEFPSLDQAMDSGAVDARDDCAQRVVVIHLAQFLERVSDASPRVPPTPPLTHARFINFSSALARCFGLSRRRMMFATQEATWLK
jgi:hypothetical protein